MYTVSGVSAKHEKTVKLSMDLADDIFRERLFYLHPCSGNDMLFSCKLNHKLCYNASVASSAGSNINVFYSDVAICMVETKAMYF